MAWARSSLAIEIQAECLLSRMQGVTWMHLYGLRYSGILPLSLQELEISCCALNADRTPPWDAAQANPITWRAERLPALKLLLTYNAVDPVRLTCPILLRCLKHLVLNFAVSLQAPIDPRFSWVLHQLLLQRLEVMLQVHTSGTARHLAVLQALAPPSITRLTLQLELHAPFPAPVQILWNAVSVGSLTLQIPCGGLVDSNSYPLQPLV